MRAAGDRNWDDLAHLPGLAAVLDPHDRSGRKNRLIDRAQKRALAGELGDVAGSRVLDFGCGTGRLTTWLTDRGARVDAVDLSPEMIALARSRAREAQVSLLETETLPFADRTFDVVLSVGVLTQHANDVRRLSTLLAELERVLVRRGRLVAIEHVRDSGLDRGTSLDGYRRSLLGAGFERVDARPVRLGTSLIARAAARVPLVAGLRPTAVMLELEARVRSGGPLTAGRYADYLFTAVAASS